MTEPDAKETRRLFRREGSGLEFDRVAFFTDAIFAIAMTLLIVGVGIPALTDGSSADELATALDERIPSFVAFFIGFFVLGGYWLAHHRMYARLAYVDGRYAFINLVYLAFVAFLPFPTGLIGEYIENPIAFVAFAGTVAGVSLMETLAFRYAWRHELLQVQMPRAVYRWGVTLSALPVALFLLSMPVAFVSTWAAILVWGLSVPAQILASRWKPEDADRYYR